MLKNEFVGKIIGSLSQIVGQSQTFFCENEEKSAFSHTKITIFAHNIIIM